MKGRWGILAAAGAIVAVAGVAVMRREGSRPAGLDDARYVLLTTYRKDGSRASTPVWFTRKDGGRIEVSTPATSWKVKRIRRDPRVELTPCDVRGGVEDGVEPLSGVARLVRGDEADEIFAGIKERYGWQATLAQIIHGARARAGNELYGSSVGLRIILTERLGESPGAE